MKNYIIIDINTAECSAGFSTKKSAIEFIKENITDYKIMNKNNYDDTENNTKKLMIVPYQNTDNKDKAELILYTNQNKLSCFDSVAEYQENIDNYEILDTTNIPVKIYYE